MLPTLLQECSEFLILTKGQPLVKNLPKYTNGFSKIKIRKKKTIQSTFVGPFNEAFNQHRNLLQRSLLANTEETCLPSQEPFYVFPINGFKFMYNPEVDNTIQHYADVYCKLTEWLKMDDGGKVFSDIIKCHYITENLINGIQNGAEIIIYGIPYYYAIRKSLVDDYKKFIYDI